MDIDEFFLGLVIGVTVLGGIWAFSSADSVKYSVAYEECQRKFNTYECEFKPKERF